jgi:predicted secreted protein
MKPSSWLDDQLLATLAGFPSGQAIYDGAGMITLELPLIVESGIPTAVSVVVNWPMVLANSVSHLYLIADLSATPLLTRIMLLPDIVPPHFTFEITLETTTYVRAMVRLGDGTALQVKRWVWVTPSSNSAGSRPRCGCAIERAELNPSPPGAACRCR